MASGKQYKNVYTILEKVKKGEIDTHYKDRDGLFGKINFYKKADLVKPYMHYIDERRLTQLVDSHIQNRETLKDMFNNTNRDIASTNQVASLEDFQKKIRENYNKIPSHLKNDIFKMFYNKMSQIEFEERTSANYTKFKFLERANNPVGKIMTESSNLKSAIFTRNIIEYFLQQITTLQYTDPNAADDLLNSLNNGNDFSDQDIDKIFKKSMDSKRGQKRLEEKMDDAQQMCNDIDKTIDKDLQDEIFQDSGDNTAGKFDKEYFNELSYRLERISMSMGPLKEKIKKLLDKSVSYFSSRKVTIHEDIFNSDNISGLDEYIFLHPKLRKVMIEDVMIKDTKNVGKIDVYIDVSGSMSGGCGVTGQDGRSIDKLDFCKAFAAKLQNMGMLNNIYIFNDYVKKIKTDVVSIALIGTSGGTNIDRAVTSIERNGVNALLITDAEDSCSIYSEKAFFIGINGCRFNSFNSQTISTYSDKGQAVMFDGKRIYPIDKNGHVVK